MLSPIELQFLPAIENDCYSITRSDQDQLFQHASDISNCIGKIIFQNSIMKNYQKNNDFSKIMETRVSIEPFKLIDYFWIKKKLVSLEEIKNTIHTLSILGEEYKTLLTLQTISIKREIIPYKYFAQIQAIEPIIERKIVFLNEKMEKRKKIFNATIKILLKSIEILVSFLLGFFFATSFR